MIESIQIADVATYGPGPQKLDQLSTFNYIFGSNGSGKTTISRIIADDAKFGTCSVKWKKQTRLQPLVYNLDFIDRNFNQSAELRGVFTLGEQNIETLNKIIEAKKELDRHIKKIETLNLSLKGEDGEGGKTGELADLEEEMRGQCWAQKQKHDAVLYGAFEGYRNNSEKFKYKLMQERATNKSKVAELGDLERRASALFGTTPIEQSPVAAIDFGSLQQAETNPILRKRIIGKEDVDIAAMIQKLGNSDWVKEGMGYYVRNGRICPFCQQATSEAFSKSLNEYFDETYANDSTALKNLGSSYATDADRVRKHLETIVRASPGHLDVEKIKTEQALLDAVMRTNEQHVELKTKEPSQTVTLDAISGIRARIEALIAHANEDIAEHNRMVANLPDERGLVSAEIWKYLIEVELKSELQSYDKRKAGLSSAIESIENQIRDETAARDSKQMEIRALEKQTTSIQPTIDEINSLLSSFGFRGFSIAKASNGVCYKLLRANGEDAKETLSEGEKSFVTFLYFYNLIKGSDSESGMTSDRVVVFDDPVSSLDSDVLFIVGSLIKDLFSQVREGKGYVKQIFIMTHNIYFHREVTFNSHRVNDQAMSEETFWIVRKDGLVSTLERYSTNPIKTSYELLWAEIRNRNRSNLSIQNTLRRILENYFKILGGIDPDSLCGLFSGSDKLICKSLFSWVHAGSHLAHDDLYITTDDSMTERYLRVFKEIFDKSGQMPHFLMMMGNAAVSGE